MEIISQFINNLNTLSTNIFLILTNLNPLILKDKVSNELVQLINTPEVNEIINLIKTKTENLIKLLTPIAQNAKKETFKHHFPLKETPYATFKVDEKPILGTKENLNKLKDKPVQLSFDDLFKQDSNIKPVKRRKAITFDVVCPHCGAPKEYIYENSKGKQYECKCCHNLFSIHPTYNDEISIRCPHCGYKLDHHHERSGYDVLVCPNDICPFYLKNKKLMENNQAEHLKTKTNGYKLKYTYRSFSIDLDKIKKEKPFNIDSKIDLSKIQHSQYTLGLVLTYYVNYGLSLRKTSQILQEIHNINISHQTIFNYAEAVASYIDFLNDNYSYDLSSKQTGDETYIKVKGLTNYVFFFSDTIKKTITSYRIFENRNTENAIRAIYQAIKKYSKIPDDLTIITDGNPIYNAAQVFFKMNDINFDLYQVIGLTNKDQTSKQYRPYKQAEERLNRTYKQNYYGTNGYGTNRNANVYMTLYVTFFNFLRKHSSLDNKVPVEIKTISNHILMPDKWLELIKISKDYYNKLAV